MQSGIDRRGQGAAAPRAGAPPEDLFGSGVTQVIDDDEGGIRYWPAVAGRDEADAWFATLRAGADWQAASRQMYDRVVDVPRLLAAYRIDDMPESLPLAAMLARVQAHVPAPYNAVGLNLYRDGQDSVAMHNDKLHTLVRGQPIALLSLGSARRMRVRAKQGVRQSIALDLAPGSLLSMSHASQLTHEHGIPKTARAIGERMSIVFRVRPPDWVADY